MESLPPTQAPGKLPLSLVLRLLSSDLIAVKHVKCVVPRWNLPGAISLRTPESRRCRDVPPLSQPIAQPLSYYDFADRRACFGRPNCLDTASNAFVVLAGAWGLVVRHLRRQRAA